MKKLRAVQERRKSIPTEHDLRDLGRDPLLSESTPYGAIVVQGPGYSEIAKLASQENFSAEWNSGHQALVVYPNRIVDGEHKVHAVTLFMFVIHHLESFHAESKIHLVEVSRLAHHLKARATQHSTPSHHEMLLQGLLQEMKHHSKESHFLSVSSPSAHHLKQAGFRVQAQGTESATFTHQALSDFRADLIREHLAEQSQQNQKLRKVG